MVGSILSVHVIDARDLVSSQRGRFPNSQVRMAIEGQSEKTQEIPSTNDPVWNEVIAFDIITGSEKLKLTIMDVLPDRSRVQIGAAEIDLATLSEEPNEIDQMKKDKLYDLGVGTSQIRLALQWIYSKVKLLEDILAQLRTQLEADMLSKQEAEDELASMEQPFGNFLFRQAAIEAESIREPEVQRKFQEMSEVTEEEHRFSRKVDTWVERKGYRPIKWAKCTFWMTILFLIITLFVHFYKPDFVNLTVCAVAIYLLSFAD